ncbi:hypothetical protein PDJAM_G00129380 [Pangasius djambal]|uniref:Uncharacterized protein n=1 Tax=Pangasius djambal TaxID=1691987 RepID=A0ACC5ZBW2_9TELE|nr:hypothetical protein [Pangasius djambal]
MIYNRTIACHPDEDGFLLTLVPLKIFHDVAYKAKDRNDLLSGIDEFLDQVTVLPPGEWDPTIRIEPPKNVPSQEKRKMPVPNGPTPQSDVVKEEEPHTGPELKRTGRLFGGLVLDVKRKAPFYWSDVRDAFSLQCLASVLFLYCACMSPVITFGGLLGEITKNNIVSFSIRCQCSPPLNATPELTNQRNQSDFTPDSINWSELDVTMCKELRGVFVGPACSHHGPFIPDVLFWSIILFFTTFFLSAFLKQFRTKRYFPTRVRSTISDFAVFLTIMFMVLLDYLVGIPSPKLNVPDTFEPTSKGRGWWMTPLGSNPWWTLLAAVIPALLCTILIFMDQQITAVIINRKEHKLKKGCGYHLDLLVVAVMLGVCSLMGLPWFVAATVLSISHVNSLKVESQCSAPGEQPKFLGIREQRVTGFMIFILMGLSVFMTSVLKEAERMLEAEGVMEYDSDNLLSIKALKVSTDPSVVNITDEMAKTSMWKAVNSDPSRAPKYRESDKSPSIKITVDDTDRGTFVDTETSL